MGEKEIDRYLLRIEGVNLSSFVFDTGDLNTIRGAGLILLTAPSDILTRISTIKEEPETITAGASWGLFQFKAQNDRLASEFAGRVREALQTDPNYQHATFVVEVLPKAETGGYVERCEQLTALSRWRQMGSLSMVVPEPGAKDERPTITRGGKTQKVTACELDHFRPATRFVKKGDDQFGVSTSTLVRREFGKENKRKKWYEETAGVKLKYDFASDFNELTKTVPDKNDGRKEGKASNQKMAVIYLDGNRFGKLRTSFCTDEAKQKRFDQKIRVEYQNGTLKTLLEEIEKNADAFDWLVAEKKKKGTEKEWKLRLETLLWGGDEVIWVAPAWNGWWLLGRFFELVKQNWKFFDGSPLTLSAGLVFCHHDAPIQRIVHLAKTLGELAKGDRTANRVAYQVLESFDHAGVDISAFRNSRCPAGVEPPDLILSGDSMLDMSETVKEIKTHIPKRRLHRLVNDLYAGESAAKTSEDFCKQFETAMVDKINRDFGKTPACWLHLLELWDFIGMENQDQEGDGLNVPD